MEIPPEFPEMCIWFDPRMHDEYIEWENRFDFSPDPVKSLALKSYTKPHPESRISPPINLETSL